MTKVIRQPPGNSHHFKFLLFVLLHFAHSKWHSCIEEAKWEWKKTHPLAKQPTVMTKSTEKMLRRKVTRAIAKANLILLRIMIYYSGEFYCHFSNILCVSTIAYSHNFHFFRLEIIVNSCLLTVTFFLFLPPPSPSVLTLKMKNS